MKRIPKDMVPGTIHKTKTSGNIEIVEYNGSLSVTVRFVETKHKKTVQACQIRRRNIKDPLFRSVSGVGFIGIGCYTPSKKGVHTSAYCVWVDMLKRCYNERVQIKHPTYKGCTVHSVWHNFQNFAKWYEENYPKDGGKYDLDKDIKIDGNKVYSPEACLFVSRLKNTQKARAVHHKAVSPDGEVIDIYNVTEFCRMNGLRQGNFSSMLSGKRKSCCGWTKHKGA
ncbi:HNH endonuclease [Vibrio phage vB_VpP_BT-1011]|uniref:Portal protein n=1 Tax=Vibrio phage vB_VpP_BT-1011 TaxID=2799672 RepID=A0A8F2XX41_9CAUD|nr:HNH endonuclease [Vibrio phage vB_VpP_BT-1011]QWX10202.1 portal protein [Vibrio phage vB_VpP_BT-1011]